MKLKIVALCAILSVASVEAQQKFTSLPIGANLDGYISSIEVTVGGPSNERITEMYPFHFPSDGKLKSFTFSKIREMIGRLPTPTGPDNAQRGWYVEAFTSGVGGLLPNYYGEKKTATIATAPIDAEDKWFSLVFQNGRWIVPEEIFGEVKFDWPAAIGWPIQGLWNFTVNVSGVLGKVAHFDVRAGIQDEGNPCALAVFRIGLLNFNPPAFGIPEEIFTAASAWWSSAEITLFTEDGRFVTFLVNRTEKDGTPIRWSNPPPSFFEPPAPKIASLKRVGNTTELLVEGNPDENVSIEWTPVLGGNWQPLKALIVPMSLNSSGKNITTHTTAGPSGFYRVRTAESQKQ